MIYVHLLSTHGPSETFSSKPKGNIRRSIRRGKVDVIDNKIQSSLTDLDFCICGGARTGIVKEKYNQILYVDSLVYVCYLGR